MYKNRKKQSSKHIARVKYAERQIDHFIKWSIEGRGSLKWKDLEMIHKKYNIKCYG
tara:strand:- start:436 stop:603 length:168 start_codon:yes stop_codon:yes gene_type:complete